MQSRVGGLVSGAATPIPAARPAVARSVRSRTSGGDWLDRMPDALRSSRTGELLEGVVDVDIDSLDVDLPRGFGRD